MYQYSHFPHCIKQGSVLLFPGTETREMCYCIGVLAAYIILSTAAAASYTSYFYTTDDVPAADIACEENVSRTASENSCLVKCAKQRCYRCRWSNGVCSLTRRGNITSSGKHISKYNKVSAVFQLTFTVKIH